jgi:hypothetical protein
MWEKLSNDFYYRLFSFSIFFLFFKTQQVYLTKIGNKKKRKLFNFELAGA